MKLKVYHLSYKFKLFTEKKYFFFLQIIKDSFLIAAVITLLCLDILALTIYTTIDQTLDPDSLVTLRPNNEIQDTEVN